MPSVEYVAAQCDLCAQGSWMVALVGKEGGTGGVSEPVLLHAKVICRGPNAISAA